MEAEDTASGEERLHQKEACHLNILPKGKEAPTLFSGTFGVAIVQGGEEVNTWSFPVDTSTFIPDEYMVEV